MSTRDKKSQIYKVIFVNQGKVFELYARNVYQGNLYGFVEVEELLFGEKSTLLVDPSEDRLKAEFAGVKRTFLPMHAIIRIDEVDKQGVSKIHAASGGDNIATFPSSASPGPVYSPPGRRED